MKRTIVASACIIAAVACEKTAPGTYEVQKPVVGTVTDTIHTPTVDVSTTDKKVGVPTIQIKKDSATIKVPTISVHKKPGH